MPFATIDEENIGKFALTFLEFAETPGQGLMHGGIIIARSHVLDVVTAIIGLHRTLLAKDHTGRYRCFTTGMTDIEAFQTCRDFLKVQGQGERLEPGGGMLAIGQACGQCLLGIGHGQLLPAYPVAAYPMADTQLTPAQLGDGGQQNREILMLGVDDQFAGQVALAVG
ncbi:hypothetical protein D3C77_552120 [compost metagenome]